MVVCIKAIKRKKNHTPHLTAHNTYSRNNYLLMYSPDLVDNKWCKIRVTNI